MDADIETPVLDDHMHLDPVNGRGVEAAEEFAEAGGTHLLVVNKPSWALLDGLPGAPADFREVFDLTVEVVEGSYHCRPFPGPRQIPFPPPGGTPRGADRAELSVAKLISASPSRFM